MKLIKVGMQNLTIDWQGTHKQKLKKEALLEKKCRSF